MGKKDKTGGETFTEQLHQKWRDSDLAQDALAAANSLHQQKDKRTSAIIRFKGWLQ